MKRARLNEDERRKVADFTRHLQQTRELPRVAIGSWCAVPAGYIGPFTYAQEGIEYRWHSRNVKVTRQGNLWVFTAVEPWQRIRGPK